MNLVFTYKSAAAEQKLSIALVLADHEVKLHSWWLICNPLFTIVYMMSAMSIVMDSYSVKYWLSMYCEKTFYWNFLKNH